MKTVLSCIQPTGEIHLGNYFGAVKNWADIQYTYQCIYGVVDLHAITMPFNPSELRQNTFNMAVELMACGINPEESILFIQSKVPEHTELTWIFNCVASYGELTRMTQFKDKSELLEKSVNKNFISAGLFTYPVLQAADILIYNAHLVPVGKDQEQHLELSRNIAVRFNSLFGAYFNEPQPLFTKIPKLMSLADPTKKMSKSLGDKHYIGLFEEEASVRKKVKSAVTDTGDNPPGVMSPGVENLFTIIKACGNISAYESLLSDYNAGVLKYKELKEVVAENLVELTSTFRNRKQALLGDKKTLNERIEASTQRARDIAQQTLKEVKKKTGLY